jgi:predicted dehydrogenase
MTDGRRVRGREDAGGRTVRVGVIGTGFGAQVVAPAFAANDGCEVVEVVSPRDDAAVAALCARADVDLVSVHSPPFLHLEHVRRAVDAGHAVLCDKPFGRDAGEAAQMVRLADDAGVANFLNFERRYDPTRVRLRELLDEGVIGTPNHFQYTRYIALPQPRPYNWLSDPSLGGGWLGGQGSHLIDATRWLFGEITTAVGVGRTLVPERPDADGNLQRCTAEDAVTLLLRTTTGVTSVIDVAIESSVHLPERTAVHGTAGMLEIQDATVVRSTAEGPVETYEVDLGGRPNLFAAMQDWAALVCEGVRSGAAAPGQPTFHDGLACAEVMDRIRAGWAD